MTSAGSIKEKAYFAFTLILKRLELLVPGAGQNEMRKRLCLRNTVLARDFLLRRLYDPHSVGLRQALERLRGKAHFALTLILKRLERLASGANHNEKLNALIV